MHDNRGPAGATPGGLQELIVEAAVRAELQHAGWRECGDGRLRFDVLGSAGPGPGPAAADLLLDPVSGAYEYGPGGRSSVSAYDALLTEAARVRAKWPTQVAALFQRWVGLPTGHEGQGAEEGLSVAVRELLIDPDNLGSVDDQPEGANGRLAGDLHRLMTEPGRSRLAGQYSRNFFRYYVNDLPATIEQLDQVLSAMRVAVSAQGEIWRRTRESLLDFESKALGAMRDSGPSGGSGNPWSTLLRVAGSLAAVIAGPAAGPVLSYVTGLISQGASLGALVTDYHAAQDAAKATDELKRHLSGDHPDAVFARMEKYLDDLDRAITTEESGVRALLAAADAVAHGPGCRIRPRGGSPGADPSVTVDPDTVGIITRLWLPSIAADARNAEKELTVTPHDGFSRVTAVGLGGTGAWAEFDRVQRQTSLMLTTLARDLEAGAEVLHDAARRIGNTDRQISGWYRAEERRIESMNINDSDDVRVRA